MLFRLLKLSVSMVLFLGDAIARRWSKLAQRPLPGTCVFLTFHTITEGARADFARQIAMLGRLARVLPGVRKPELEKGVHHVVVTFDDAFQSFFRNALPVLAEAKVPVLLFVPTGYMGRKSAWFDYGGENPVGEEVVSAEELEGWVRDYAIEIGSHTVSHPNLAQISEEEVRAELRDSRKKLESLCRRKVNSVSFPYGSGGGREAGLAAEAGYDFCFGVLPETLAGSIHPGLIGRVSVQPADWDIEFKLKVLGAYRWLSRASAWKKKAKRAASSIQMKEIKLHG
jgi:peptidoglycan/xylan/chitin deacetylase (PgdA/CDA1 family)